MSEQKDNFNNLDSLYDFLEKARQIIQENEDVVDTGPLLFNKFLCDSLEAAHKEGKNLMCNIPPNTNTYIHIGNRLYKKWIEKKGE
jgi:hypothetical protein